MSIPPRPGGRPHFDSLDLACLLAVMTNEQLDELDFGAIAMDRTGIITAYNRNESQRSQLSPNRMVGRNFFTDVGPCTDHDLVAGRFRHVSPDLGALADPSGQQDEAARALHDEVIRTLRSTLVEPQTADA